MFDLKRQVCSCIRLLYIDNIFYLGWFWGSKCNENCKRNCCSIESLVFRIRICDVTFKFKLKVSFGILWKIMVELLTIKWLIRGEKVN